MDLETWIVALLEDTAVWDEAVSMKERGQKSSGRTSEMYGDGGSE